MEIFVYIVSGRLADLSSDGRFGDFMHPNAPLKFFSLEMVDPIFRGSERYHHVDSVVA